MTVKKWVNTIDTTAFSNEDYKNLKIGQWVKIMDNKGQFLGVTYAGIVTINYKKAPTMKSQFKANKPLRQFAKIMGAF